LKSKEERYLPSSMDLSMVHIKHRENQPVDENILHQQIWMKSKEERY